MKRSEGHIVATCLAPLQSILKNSSKRGLACSLVVGHVLARCSGSGGSRVVTIYQNCKSYIHFTHNLKKIFIILPLNRCNTRFYRSWEYCLPSMQKTLSLIPSTTKTGYGCTHPAASSRLTRGYLRPCLKTQCFLKSPWHTTGHQLMAFLLQLNTEQMSWLMKTQGNSEQEDQV